MSNSIFQLCVELERDIASFYEKVKNVSRYKSNAIILNKMVEESTQHAASMENMAKDIEIPVFNKQIVLTLQEKIKNSLWNEIMNEPDTEVVKQKLAKTEETAGKMYYAISGYLNNLAEYYKKLAKKVEGIALQELNHMESILKL